MSFYIKTSLCDAISLTTRETTAVALQAALMRDHGSI
jgi:hypothetical protein